MTQINVTVSTAIQKRALIFRENCWHKVFNSERKHFYFPTESFLVKTIIFHQKKCGITEKLWNWGGRPSETLIRDMFKWLFSFDWKMSDLGLVGVIFFDCYTVEIKKSRKSVVWWRTRDSLSHASQWRDSYRGRWL